MYLKILNIDCLNNCDNCNNSKICNNCTIGNYLSFNSTSCNTACREGETPINGRCTPCDVSNCKKCDMNKSNCDYCTSGLKLYNNTCNQTYCPEGTYMEDEKCKRN